MDSLTVSYAEEEKRLGKPKSEVARTVGKFLDSLHPNAFRLAQVERVDRLQDALLSVLSLLAVLLVLILLAHWARRRFLRGRGESESASLLLSDFRKMYERGELSEEEFRDIKSRLGRKLVGEGQESAPAPHPPPLLDGGNGHGGASGPDPDPPESSPHRWN